MKLIKITETHYIIVDHSEIKESDFVYYKCASKALNPPKNGIYKIEKITNKVIQLCNNAGTVESSFCKKITHSTEPINESTQPNTEFYWNTVSKLSLSEVEELVYGYSVKKMAEGYLVKVYNDEEKAKEYLKFNDAFTSKMYISYTEGFRNHKELAKDKVFTVEDMRKGIDKAFEKGRNRLGFYNSDYDSIIQPLLPPTEWDVKFDEHGKLKLV